MRELLDKLARLPAAGDVTVFGIGEHSVRIWQSLRQSGSRQRTETLA
jgi:hypothetical protein